MINEYTTKLSELFTYVVGAPIGIQVIIGTGALLLAAAAKNIWGVLYPIRWAIATTLRGGAWIINPRSKVRSATPFEIARVPFSFATKEDYIRTLHYYASTEAKCSALSKVQLRVLREADKIWMVPTTHDAVLRNYVLTLDKMHQAEKLLKTNKERAERLKQTTGSVSTTCTP